MKHPAKTDIAVLLLFFTRSDTFARVFEAVRQARPSKLFLYQDGPRGERDMAGIMTVPLSGRTSWRTGYGRYHGLQGDCQ